jgi:hypothetical protein
MSGTAELTGLYSAIEDAAQLLDVTCSRDTVWPILTAYGNDLPQAVIAFRVATGARNAGELDCRFTMLPKEVDPYAVALSNGLVGETDHPVGALLSDLHGRFPIDCCGIDFGVVGGFKKTWSFFPPDDLQEMSRLADIPSAPPALGENLAFYSRYGLGDKASLIGIDYRNRTVNVYFGEPPAEIFQRKTIQAMLRDLGLPEPSEQMLRLGQVAFGIYVTLSWDSLKIERLCLAVMTQDLPALPVPIEPVIEKFSTSAPCTAADRRFVYAVTASPGGEYNKLQSYYQWRPRMLNLMLLSDSVADAEGAA